MKVYFLADAEEDLKELRRYIQRSFGEPAWRETYQKIKNSLRALQSAPQSGSIPEELAVMNFHQYRQVISGMNRILYEIREDALYIHIVCDGRRDMRTLLNRRLVRPPR